MPTDVEIVVRIIDLSKLTDAQLDGRACIKCGATSGPMIPVMEFESIQLFRCQCECTK
jgi:hypothetical protein